MIIIRIAILSDMFDFIGQGKYGIDVYRAYTTAFPLRKKIKEKRNS